MELAVTKLLLGEYPPKGCGFEHPVFQFPARLGAALAAKGGEALSVEEDDGIGGCSSEGAGVNDLGLLLSHTQLYQTLLIFEWTFCVRKDKFKDTNGLCFIFTHNRKIMV